MYESNPTAISPPPPPTGQPLGNLTFEKISSQIPCYGGSPGILAKIKLILTTGNVGMLQFYKNSKTLQMFILRISN